MGVGCIIHRGQDLKTEILVYGKKGGILRAYALADVLSV